MYVDDGNAELWRHDTDALPSKAAYSQPRLYENTAAEHEAKREQSLQSHRKRRRRKKAHSSATTEGVCIARRVRGPSQIWELLLSNDVDNVL